MLQLLILYHSNVNIVIREPAINTMLTGIYYHFILSTEVKHLLPEKKKKARKLLTGSVSEYKMSNNSTIRYSIRYIIFTKYTLKKAQ